MSEWKRDRIGAARAGRNPTVMAHLTASFAVIGDVQFLPGYAVALVDRPGVDRLSDLPRIDRRNFLADVDLIAEAVESTCLARDPAFRRVNIEILGNSDPFLHAHVWPRYDWEPKHLQGGPVWLYPAESWSAPPTRLGAQHDGLRRDLRTTIARLQQEL
jgi:diadenosine tetraphosphate (Ap4A) HIT family hydrolase